jgi:LmbE family N-acetylglucosaminyl deacetylase
MMFRNATETYRSRFEHGQEQFDTTVAFVKEQQIPCVFVSPHLDDAVLSNGGLISEFSRDMPGKVYVISVFTRVSPLPHTRHVHKFQIGSTYRNAYELFAARTEEDTMACKKLGATAIHLDFVDAGYRKRDHPHPIRQAVGTLFPEVLHLYPTSFSIGRQHVDRRERFLIQDVKAKLLEVIGTIGLCVIFSPVGGKRTHVDHLITRQSCQQAFPKRVIYSRDYPYSLWSPPDNGFIQKYGLSPGIYGKRKEERHEAIACYASQVTSCFAENSVPAAADLPDEVYWLDSEVLECLKCSIHVNEGASVKPITSELH